LTKIIDVLKNALTNSDEKKFKYAISFLKKMSGDWLQVLLTLAIDSRTRGFTPYTGARENVTAKIDRVFFVTHDQIALSFALLMGVECLFTHHGPVEGNPSLHSIFLYSLASEATVNESIIKKAMALNPNYDEEIAAIATYERNAWENNTNDLIQPEEVAKQRQHANQQPTMVNKIFKLATPLLNST
jgi:hypothetical protein